LLGFRERVAADAGAAWARGACSTGGRRPRRVSARDGNGAPIPDPRRGFNPLGDLNGSNLLPVGSLTGQI